MAITNYGELKTALADWSARADLAAQLPVFVTMAETVFNLGEGDNPLDPAYIAPLRCRQMEATSPLTMASFLVPLPSDYLETRRVQTTASTPRTLKYATPEWYSEAYPLGDTSDFEFYSILGGNVLTGASLTFDYYQKIPTLVGAAAGDTAVNWLLTDSPNAYLFGGLYCLAIFMQDAENAAAYRGLMLSATGGYRRTARLQRADRPVMRASMTAF